LVSQSFSDIQCCQSKRIGRYGCVAFPVNQRTGSASRKDGNPEQDSFVFQYLPGLVPDHCLVFECLRKLSTQAEPKETKNGS
jgi:hypothetical protein